MAVFPRKFPRRGEIYWVDFTPARGAEQEGKRPAVIVSNDTANHYAGTVTVVALTSTVYEKQYPQNVHLPAGVLEAEGTILCAQVMTIAKERLGNHLGDLPADKVLEVNRALAKALALQAPPRPDG